jgi:hypothetical protein
MRARGFAVGLTALVVGAGAAQAHPSLYFGDDEITRIRERAADTSDTGHGWSFADVYGVTVTAADAGVAAPYTYEVDVPDLDGSGSVHWTYTLSTSIPPPHANNPSYPPWTMVSRGLQSRMETLAMAYVVTGDQAYLTNSSGTGALDVALKVAAWSTWTDPGYSCASSCLDTAHLTTGVALVYDVAYPVISDAQRTTLRSALINKGLTRLATDVAATRAASGEGSVPSNLHALRTAALAVGAAAVAGETNADAWIALAHAAITQFLDLQGEDGGYFEGHVYGSYAISYLVVGAHVLTRRGAEDLLAHAWFTSLPRFAAAFLASDLRSTANFGDSSTGAIFYVGPMFALAARGDRAAQWYLTATGTTRPGGILSPLLADPGLEPEPITGSGTAAFTHIGHAALRAGFAGAPVVAVKSGPSRVSVGHNHLDANSFVINAFGEWIASDPGYRSYFNPAQRLYTTGTIGHNTIMVDKSVSADGASATGGQSSLTGGSLEYLFDGAGYARIVANAAATYPAGQLSRFGRRVLYAKPDLVWVFDDLAAPGPRSFSWLLHTIPGGRFTAGEGPAEMVTRGFRARLQEFLVATTPWASGHPRSLSHPGAESYGPYAEWRTAPASETRIAAALVPGPHIHAEPANPGFEDGLSSWSPRRPDPTHAVDTEVHRGGAASARISFTTADAGYFYSEPLTVAPGGRASARVWARAGGDTNGTLSIRIHWMRKGVYLEPSGEPVELSAGDAADWTELSLPPATAPAGADALRVAVNFAGTGTAWFDDAATSIDNPPDPPLAEAVPLGSPAIGLVVTGAFGIEAGASRVGSADSASVVTLEPQAEVAGFPSLTTDAALFAVGLDLEGRLRRAFVQGGTHLAVGGDEVVRAACTASFDLAVERNDDGCAVLTLTEVETLENPPYVVRSVPSAVFIGTERVPFAVRGDEVEFPAGDDLGPGCEVSGGDGGPGDPDDDTASGCGCRAGGSGSGGLLLLALLGLAVRRSCRRARSS